MAVKVHIGPSIVTVNQGSTCMVTDLGGEIHTESEQGVIADDTLRQPGQGCPMNVRQTDDAKLHQRWIDEATELDCASEQLHRWYRQSVEDLGALRLHDHDMADDVQVPAGGVPWFVIFFGRDSLVAGLQNMIVNPAFARGCLKKLAEFQAKKSDDWRDAD